MKMNDVFKVDGAVIRTLTNRKMYEEDVYVSN